MYNVDCRAMPGLNPSCRNWTFATFVAHVMRNPLGEIHWMPGSRRCNPASGNYSLVMRLEHYAEDLRLLLAALHWPLNLSNTHAQGPLL